MSKLGTVHLEYKQDGSIKSASFVPEVKIEAKEGFVSQLNNLKSSDEPSKILNQARKVFSNWFNFMNQVEMGDAGTISSSINYESCERFGDGMIKKCEIIFNIN